MNRWNRRRITRSEKLRRSVTSTSAVAFIKDATQETQIPIIKVDAVDTSGTGDVFTAQPAVSLTDGITLQEAARRASLVAAITVTHSGTQVAFPHRVEVAEWVD